jgi:hypothetical protein
LAVKFGLHSSFEETLNQSIEALLGTGQEKFLPPDLSIILAILSRGHIHKFAKTPFYPYIAEYLIAEKDSGYASASLSYAVALLCINHLHNFAGSLVLSSNKMATLDRLSVFFNINTSIQLLGKYLGSQAAGSGNHQDKVMDTISWKQCAELCAKALEIYKKDCQIV